MRHPREVLLGSQAGAVRLPVCDHYSGVERRMRKSLELQAQMSEEFGACVFDVTLDCEDGAPVGGELAHAQMVAQVASEAQAASARRPDLPRARVAVRVHAVDHPAFASDLETILPQLGDFLCHVMIPKVESLADVELAVHAVDQAGSVLRRPVPLHVLIESPVAVHRAFDIAAHPRVQSISFGLMDFVSAHGGAIPASAMGVQTVASAEQLDQFSHPLVARAKLEIASACHANGKVPSHCVVTELSNAAVLQRAAARAAREFGFTRMWSIHPEQIRSILAGFAPAEQEVDHATRVIVAAAVADWAPIAVDGQLHDRASYRYFWQVLERAQQTGLHLPNEVQCYFQPLAADLAGQSSFNP